MEIKYCTHTISKCFVLVFETAIYFLNSQHFMHIHCGPSGKIVKPHDHIYDENKIVPMSS